MEYNQYDDAMDQRHHRPHSPDLQVATRAEVDAIFQLCRSDKWRGVLAQVEEKPYIALTPMVMDNHISTTIIHQAITSKSDTTIRAQVIATILAQTPQAAAIRNGYGSLPLHVICQRNTKMDAQTKETLVKKMVPCYPAALMEQGGVGKRTPLHIIFTDYISPKLTQMMIDSGAQACFMKDKKGLLPAHVACMRHCSPDKLRMLLAVHPGALYEPTNAGETLLMLATETATKAHPNYALIDELNRQLAGGPNVPENEMTSPGRRRHHHNQDHAPVRPMPPLPAYRPAYYEHNDHHHYQVQQQHHQHHQYHHQHQYHHFYPTQHHGAPFPIGRVSSEDDEPWPHRARLDSNDSNSSWLGSGQNHGVASITPMTAVEQEDRSTSRKRKAEANPDRGVDLLLHFSRKSNGTTEHGAQYDDTSPQMTAAPHGRAKVDWDEHHAYTVPDRVAEV